MVANRSDDSTGPRDYGYHLVKRDVVAYGGGMFRLSSKKTFVLVQRFIAA
jgi:hypothetical protein